MHRQGRKKGTIQFAIRPAGYAERAMLAGDFSNWQPLPMDRLQDGTFVCDAAVGTETFEYKFLIDGKWITDPDHGSWVLSPMGTLNSLGFANGSSPDGSAPGSNKYAERTPGQR